MKFRSPAGSPKRLGGPAHVACNVFSRCDTHLYAPGRRRCLPTRAIKGGSMKKLVASVISVLALSAPAFAATWTGVISDSMCGKSHAAMTGNGSKMTDSQCTTACVEHGAKYVFV